LTIYDIEKYSRVILDAYSGDAPDDKSRVCLYQAARSLCLAGGQDYLDELAQLALEAGYRQRDIDTTIARAQSHV